MYANVKQRAKEKDSDKKKTGGGPNLKLTQCEDMVLDGIRDKPQLGGIIGGLDTSSTVTECSKTATSGQSSTDTAQDPTEPAATSGMPEKGDVNGSACRLQSSMANSESYAVINGKSKRRKVVVDELYELEKKRAQAEILLLEQRRDQEAAIFKIKRDMLQATMEQEKILFELKGKVLQENLNKALEQNLLLWNEN
ncbi:uncharacterized protein LOC123530571 isoform X2 [Mercenaria mercenaria]|nr:uncharacterized protein LOC123530571 isoform X2 [Mercenaria mercenaria]